MAFQPQASWNLRFDSIEPWAYLDNLFPDIQCERIIEIGNSLDRETAKTHGDDLDRPELRKNTVAWFNSRDPVSEFIFRRSTDAVLQLNDQFWKFDLDYIESLQYTCYETLGDHYGAHLDFDDTWTNYRKLSFSVLLDDPSTFEGGDLEIFVGSEPKALPRKRGTLIAFPSFMMHRVTPVTRGQRHSLVGWVCGPRFR